MKTYNPDDHQLDPHELYKKHLDDYELYRHHFHKINSSNRRIEELGGLPNPVTSEYIEQARDIGKPLVKDKLTIGAFYYGSCRNARIAQWNGTNFTHIRYKFGYEYSEIIPHFENDNGYDVFLPYFQLDKYDLKIPWIKLETEKLQEMIDNEDKH